jgi:hypothetical protein
MTSLLFTPTATMRLESKRQRVVYRLLVLLMALGQFLCAAGSGPSSGPDPVSAWTHTAMNVANTALGLIVFIPRTRAMAAVLSATISALSMAANYIFYGAPYFVKLLPFDGLLFIVSLLITMHYLPDLRHTLDHERSKPH